jgi:hypothetical protein
VKVLRLPIKTVNTLGFRTRLQRKHARHVPKLFTRIFELLPLSAYENGGQSECGPPDSAVNPECIETCSELHSSHKVADFLRGYTNVWEMFICPTFYCGLIIDLHKQWKRLPSYSMAPEVGVNRGNPERPVDIFTSVCGVLGFGYLLA